MERRLAVHADPTGRQKVSAWLVVLAALALASPAAAAPKAGPAKAAFDRGVAAYQKGDFAVASEQLAVSFKLDPDPETLFAWAQSERQLEHCDKAIELFEKLLTFNLPAENKKVVQSKIDECKALAPKPPEKPPEKQPEKPPEAPPERQPETPPGDGAPPSVGGAAGAEGSPWWKDPIGDALVGVGAVGLIGGGVLLLSAKSAADKRSRTDIKEMEFEQANDDVESYGKLGLTATIVGGVLVVGGIVRYVTRGGGKERTAVTGWFSPEGGGIAAIGRF